MLHHIVKLEAKVGEKVYHMLCDNDSPINDVKEALFQFTKIAAEIEEKVLASRKQPEEQPAEVAE